jgi:hypothetical protein
VVFRHRCNRFREQGVKGKRRRSEEVTAREKGFEVAIGMGQRRWTTSVYKTGQKVCTKRVSRIDKIKTK